jgi:flagellar motor switch protein FliN
VTTDQALLKITASTAEAVTESLRVLCGPNVVPSPAKVVGDDEHPLADVAMPAVVACGARLDGASGGSVICLPVAAAHHLAAVMMGADPPADDAAALSEIELSAIGEAMDEMLSAAAQATAVVLGQALGSGTPETKLVTSVAQADELVGDRVGAPTPHVDFTLMGAPCRLVALVPDAIVAQVTRALDEVLTQHDAEPLKAALRDIPVRVWVELGRTRMPLGRFVALPAGEVVELDRAVDDPVDLYVDGMHVARGRLVVSDTGDSLALQIESVIAAGGAPDVAVMSAPLVAGDAAAA